MPSDYFCVTKDVLKKQNYNNSNKDHLLFISLVYFLSILKNVYGK